MPTECPHGRIIDPGDFDAKVEDCRDCEKDRWCKADAIDRAVCDMQGDCWCDLGAMGITHDAQRRVKFPWLPWSLTLLAGFLLGLGLNPLFGL